MRQKRAQHSPQRFRETSYGLLKGRFLTKTSYSLLKGRFLTKTSYRLLKGRFLTKTSFSLLKGRFLTKPATVCLRAGFLRNQLQFAQGPVSYETSYGLLAQNASPRPA
jgi:hypothetical protein